VTLDNYGAPGWQSWSWTATNAGLYTLEFGVANGGDNMYGSYALFDADVNAPVPEPGTGIIMLLGAGLISVSRFIKKRRAA